MQANPRVGVDINTSYFRVDIKNPLRQLAYLGNSFLLFILQF